ncbi:MAG: hypothetical protein R6X02_06350 [Enhygromyxa sp.]
MKTLRLLSLCLVGSAVTLSACAKDSDGTESTGLTAATTDNNESDDDTSGGNTDFGEEGSQTGDGDGDDDPTTTTNGSGFVPQDDLGGASSCDPWAQDCPEDEKCVAYASSGGTWDANKCVPIGGDGQPGDPCTYAGAVESTDSCGADSWCWDVGAEGTGTCTGFCTGSPDNPQCDPGTACSIANNGSINLCMLACNPLLQDCPSEGTSCFWDGGNFVCANATQDIPAGEPCGFINDCVGGTICLAPEAFPSCNGASCCGQFCDLAEPTCSISGTECTAFFEEGTAPPNYEDVGVCIVPG